MEDYIIEISKYYFKGVLDNEVIQKVLSKKEEKFPIQEKVVKELDDLKEFILEMSKLNFPLNSIKESVDSFIRDSEYLQKTPNLNIDIEDILEDSLIEKTENIENNEIDNEITENRELEVIDNEKIEIIPNVIIDKNFEANSFFEVICNLYLETFVNLGNLVFQETDFDSIANGNFENKIKSHIQSLKNKLINLIPINDIDIHLFDSNFYDYLNRMNNITQIAREERGNISSNLSELKTLQKLSRNSGSSFFVGNLYAMGAFAAFKGIKSICNSVSDSNERNRLKSSMESNFMKQFYDYMEENLQSDLLSTMSVIVNTFSSFLSLHSNLTFKRFEELIDVKNRFENEYKNLPEKVKKSDYHLVTKLLSLYPYSEEIWNDFFSVISIDEFFILEKNLKENHYSYTLEKLSLIKDKKILIDSNDLELVHSTINKIGVDYTFEIFKEHFNENIDKNNLEFFIKILRYIFEDYDISSIFSKKYILIANLFKETLNKNLETYFEKNKMNIFMYATDISKILEKNILLMNFLPVKEIIAYISEAYNKYIEDIKTAENQNLINVQSLINNDLEVIKNIPLAERNFMKYFIIFDYFKHNSFVKNLINNSKNLNEKNIHLTWNTKGSAGIITLTSLIFKIKDKEKSITIANINKVKIDNLSIELETDDRTYLIPIFNINEGTAEKDEAVKALALYIKKLSKYWQNINIDLKIYINNHFREIDNLFSKPRYSLEFIFDKNLRTQDIFRIFLKNGFVTEKDIASRRNLFNYIASNLQKYAKLTNKIEIYPFDEKKISEIQNLTKSYLGKSINSEILAVYYENEFFDRDKSVIVLTERSIVILTNSFGEIPFNIINSLSLSGFSSHSLEFKTIKGNFSCLLNTNEDSNKIFIDLVKECISLIN
ncbi:hypothetical protein KST14_02555 [Fusobacterium animalis]|uniref:hypothetical protein n=1 Tax=Fusobacterium animalis TaxID=76859 RepID=UPI0030CED44D